MAMVPHVRAGQDGNPTIGGSGLGPHPQARCSAVATEECSAMKCLSCSSELPPGSRFCLCCGCRLTSGASESNTETETMARAEPAAALAKHILPSASGGGRFLPGTLLAGRYRVIGLVGRGGMGEVYQATDLKLEQPVALKFLPEARAADPSALARLCNETRIAR